MFLFPVYMQNLSLVLYTQLLKLNSVCAIYQWWKLFVGILGEPQVELSMCNLSMVGTVCGNFRGTPS